LILCAAIALAWNLIRTLVLVLIAHAQGTEAMAAWHDHIGTTALLLALASWILLAQGAGRLARPRCAEDWIVPGAPRRRGLPPGTSVSSPASLSPVACWVLIACAAVCHLAVEAWYWPTRASRDRPFDWTVRWPADVRTRELPIAAATRGVLKYSHGTNRVWEDQAGRRWSAFHLQWAPGRTAHAVAQVHRPEICLPAAGRDMLEDRGVRLFETARVVLPFRHYVFRDGDLPLHVFFTLATRRGTDHRSAPVANDLTRAERFRAVRERRRNEGQQQLEIGLWGARTSQEAEHAFAQALETLLVPTSPGGRP
jgi:hypothetical protein